MSESNNSYTVTEADVVERLTMIGVEMQITKDWMQESITKSLLEEEIFVDICEYYTTLYRLEAVLFEIIDYGDYDKDGGVYYLSMKQKTHLMVFLHTLYAIRDTLLRQNISLRLH